MLPESLELSRFKAVEQDTWPAADKGTVLIPPEGVQLDEILERLEKDHITEALKLAKGSITGAAKLLGISFRSMRYRLEKGKFSEKMLKP